MQIITKRLILSSLIIFGIVGYFYRFFLAEHTYETTLEEKRYQKIDPEEVVKIFTPYNIPADVLRNNLCILTFISSASCRNEATINVIKSLSKKGTLIGIMLGSKMKLSKKTKHLKNNKLFKYLIWDPNVDLMNYFHVLDIPSIILMKKGLMLSEPRWASIDRFLEEATQLNIANTLFSARQTKPRA